MLVEDLLKDCRVDTYRAGEFDVQVTHLPTGIVERDHDKSAMRARERCLQRIAARLPSLNGGSDGIR